MGFFEDNWLWRGTQSAIFYYVSCSPCVELKYKRKRKNEAARSEKQKSEIITAQPGHVPQPGAFQTNTDWAEEILMGPGPPKGWKRDPVAEKAPIHESKGHYALSDQTNGNLDISSPSGREPVLDSEQQTVTALVHQESVQSPGGFTSLSTSEPASISSNVNRRSTGSSNSSLGMDESSAPPRPSLDRRLSTAMDNLRDTLRSTMRPEKWNWIRYERDDEILSGFNQRMTKMWDKATNFATTDRSEESLSQDQSDRTARRRRRASTNDSDRFDFQRYTRNPEINDLHPPVVSRLPATRDEAAWMILPPPSAAVMEGKARPQDQTAMRWPLARIGRTPQDRHHLEKNNLPYQNTLDARQREGTPELSDSLTESGQSDEEQWSNQVLKVPSPAVNAHQQALELINPKGRELTRDRDSWILNS